MSRSVFDSVTIYDQTSFAGFERVNVFDRECEFLADCEAR
jgi:hypothetical protein